MTLREIWDKVPEEYRDTELCYCYETTEGYNEGETCIKICGDTNNMTLHINKDPELNRILLGYIDWGQD